MICNSQKICITLLNKAMQISRKIKISPGFAYKQSTYVFQTTIFCFAQYCSSGVLRWRPARQICPTKDLNQDHEKVGPQIDILSQ